MQTQTQTPAMVNAFKQAFDACGIPREKAEAVAAAVAEAVANNARESAAAEVKEAVVPENRIAEIVETALAKQSVEFQKTVAALENKFHQLITAQTGRYIGWMFLAGGIFAAAVIGGVTAAIHAVASILQAGVQ